MKSVKERIIEKKLDAIEKLYHKLHVETNKQYFKYDEVKRGIEAEVKQLEKEILELSNDK